ncbi:pentatricopeptide repeat protein [Rutstroemia sp. NJR-2017a WRK4]|nr:pentatricopeptide repeat protein [Rutstroemia sp. NJR-2017a WRK4]
MPSNLPVPSKGALRTLRKLALGTSCTIAFSAGVLTEDRRRRIHSAKQVHDNATKLRQSRNYNNTSSQLVEGFADHALQHTENGFWSSGSGGASNDKNSETVLADGQLTGEEEAVEGDVERMELLEHELFKRRPINHFPIEKIQPPKLSRQHQEETHFTLGHQSRLALDVRQILDDEEDSSALDAALMRFLEAFREGIDIGDNGLEPSLLDAAALLSSTCETAGRVEDMEMILDVILSAGSISQSHFNQFGPHIIIKSLLKGSIDISGRLIAPDKLKKAASLYLTPFTDRPKAIAPALESLASDICFDACRLKHYDLTVAVFHRTRRVRGTVSDKAMGSFIIASHHVGNHRDAIHFFFKHFLDAPVNQQMFWDVTNVVVESSIIQQRYPHFGELQGIVAAALKTAETHDLKLSTTVLLRLLGLEWRTSRNISQTQARFDRLEGALAATSHPQAAYGAIIQFCIEAKEFAAAEKYQLRLWERFGHQDDARIAGHFALAKAMKEDWDGVENDFARISELRPDKEVYGSIFVPILQQYVKTHPVTETQEFLLSFLETYQVPFTPYLFNLMVDAYAKHKEIDALARWVGYANSLATFVNTVTVNTILNRLYKSWSFNFEDVCQLYRAIQKVSTSCTDSSTEMLLRQIALAESNGDWSKAQKKLKGLPCTYKQRPPDIGSFRLMMTEALVQGNPEKALRVYEEAQDDGIFIHPAALSNAVKASLRIEGKGMDHALSLIKQAKEKGYDLSESLVTLLTYQLPRLERDYRSSYVEFMDSVRKSINSLEERGIAVPPQVFTQVISILVNKGHLAQAIQFWTTVSHGRTSKEIKLDVVSLTVLLKAYLNLRDSPGVTWVMTMLSVNNVFPDTQLKLLLKNVRKEIRSQRPKTRFHQVVEDAYQCVIEMRANALQDNQDAKKKTLSIMQDALKSQNAQQRKSSESSTDKHSVETKK